MRVYKVTLWSGSGGRARGYRRRALWSARVEATAEAAAILAAQSIHEAQVDAGVRVPRWSAVKAVGKITVREVH